MLLRTSVARGGPGDGGGSVMRTSTVRATAHGLFTRGLQRGADVENWGGASWIGLSNSNDTAAQYRSVVSLRSFGLNDSASIVHATLFVAGLGGHRASINGRPLDPAGVRGSVTEWSNRTFYFSDNVTQDVKAAAGSDGLVAVGIELYKHWYGLANDFYTVPYGPRSLKAVLVVTLEDGSNVFVSPTCSGTTGRTCSWRHGSGTTVYEDLHTGQIGDGRLATPGWESTEFVPSSDWKVPTTVAGPPGELRPHPMQRSRVLEIVRPITVAPVMDEPSSLDSGATYRFTLPHEVAGFCTLLLPSDAPAGMKAEFRHGEAVDMGTGLLVDVECTGSLGPQHGLHCVRMSYIARGDASGMSAHDKSWRQLAQPGNISISHTEAFGSDGTIIDSKDVEAFTPAFQFSAFRFIQVTYSQTGAGFKGPDDSSLACYRIGTSFDWTGDVKVAAGPAQGGLQRSVKNAAGTTAAERFNVVVAATRSTAVSNYLMDVPTDCPHREKRGWTGDSAVSQYAVSSFFDMRAAWTKWIDDIVFTQSMLQRDGGPPGNMPTIVPCIFPKICRNDPRKPPNFQPASVLKSDVAWGSVLPLVGVTAAKLTGDARLSSRAATGSAAYVALLHMFANNASTGTEGLLNSSAWDGNLGDWCPAIGPPGGKCSTLLNSHHLILDIDAAVTLLQQSRQGGIANALDAGIPTEAELLDWASTARTSFAKAFLRNITVPGTGTPNAPPSQLCGSAHEGNALALSCGDPRQTIDQITFAGYGLTNGSCSSRGGFHPNSKCYFDVSHEVSKICVGRSACSVECVARVPHLRICAGANVNDPCQGISKQLAVSATCTPSPSPSPSPSPFPNKPIVGLAFRDLYPPAQNGPQAQTEAASGMAAMNLAPDSLISNVQRAALGDMLAALVINHTAANPKAVVYTGGIIDMSHLAPELIEYGHPDAAFNFLAADGSPSYYSMAKYGGTLWENWKNANGCDTKTGCENPDVNLNSSTAGKGVGSLNHIMYGGSVGSAVFGIGGIHPFGLDGEQINIRPIPWLPDAPLGAAVWRSRAGVVAAAWAASSEASHVWINVTVPAASAGASIQVMLPQSVEPANVCAWECGTDAPGDASTYTSEWISFDAGGGYNRLRALVPPSTAIDAPSPTSFLDRCTPIWRSGQAEKVVVVGMESIKWKAAQPGRTMFPALEIAATSGTYAFFARSCSNM